MAWRLRGRPEAASPPGSDGSGPPTPPAPLPNEDLVHGEVGGVRVLYLQAGSMPELGQRLAMLLSEHMTEEEDCHVSYSSMQSGWRRHPAPRRGVFSAPAQPWTEFFFTYSALVVLRPRQRFGDSGADR